MKIPNIESLTTTEKQPAGPNSSVWPSKQQKIAEMRQLYGTAEQFLATFNPALQLAAARHAERAYRGTAPQLATVCVGYGEPVAVVWLCIQIENVNLFAGVKEKMSVERQKELAGLILTEYAYLKTSELLLFFHRLKCGRYGRFYGAVDALFIASALLLFLDERRKDLARLQADDERRRQAKAAASAASRQAASPGMTYEEYLSLKRRQQADIAKKTQVEGTAPDEKLPEDPFSGLLIP